MNGTGLDGTEQSRQRRLRAHIGLLCMVGIWAVNFVVAKIALNRVSPLAFNALRFPLASVALYGLLRMRGPIPWPSRHDAMRVVWLGLLGHLLYQQFFIFGLANIAAGTASLLLSSTPLMTALLSAAYGHERVNPRVWVGVTCTLIGITMVVLFGPKGVAGENSLLGAVLLFAASLSWAFYTVGSRNLIAKYGSLSMTAWTLWIGSVFILLLGWPDVLHSGLARLTTEDWLAVIYAGVLSIGVAYMFWYAGVKELGNTRTSTYSNLVPALTLIVAWLWLGEVPTAGQIAGAAVIIGGVTLAQRAPGGRDF